MQQDKKISEQKMYGDEKARIRANREASSAPTTREQRTYSRELKRVLDNAKSVHVLVLGATPELRDITIMQGAECLSVDWSWNTLTAMTEVMQHGGMEKDSIMRCDWKNMSRYLEHEYFDAILGDASLLNTSFSAQNKVLQNCEQLLKSDGRLILRHAVYLSNKHITLKEWQIGYDAGKFYWLSALWPLGHYVGNSYDKKHKIWSVEKAFQDYYTALKRGKIRLNKNDCAKLDNIYAYGKNVLHWIEPKEDFENRVKKWYSIERLVKNQEMVFSEAVPIYVLKKL